jgi:hypothetical protein
VLLSAFLGQRVAQNIADGFGAIMIAAALAQAIQRVEQIVIKSNRDTLHLF